MSAHMISIYALIAMFVIAFVLPVNMGAIAFAGAFLVGTLVAGMQTKAIMAGFRAELFLTLVGITFLFAQAQNNGTIDWLVRLAVRAVRGRIAAIPWIMFGIAALLTAVGAVNPTAVAIIAPIALGFAAKYGINQLMMGLMVIHGAQGRGLLADQHLRRHHQQDRAEGWPADFRSDHGVRQPRRQPRRRRYAVLPARRPTPDATGGHGRRRHTGQALWRRSRRAAARTASVWRQRRRNVSGRAAHPD